MKKLLLLLLALITTIGISSCHNDAEEKEEYPISDSDFNPIILIVKVINSNGQDLLDKNIPNNILDEKMTLTIDGLTTDVAMTRPKGEKFSRALMPTWFGAYIWQINGTEEFYVIDIGDFDGALNGRRSIELNLCGQKYELSFTNDVTYDRKNKKYICDRCFYLEGQLIQSGGSPLGKYTITLDR